MSPVDLPIRGLPTLLAVFLLASSILPAVAVDQVRATLADGFDYPVGRPEATGYYKARGFRPNVHLGEDWNGRGGGNTDLGDPVYVIGDGIVVYSDDYRVGWGNVIIVRHAYRDRGATRFIDSLYGHLNERFVRQGQSVRRGQKIGTIGTNRGMYWAHLHFEIRKNINIGMRRSSFAQDYSNYWSPSDFIEQHRNLRREDRTVMMPVNNWGAGGATVASEVRGNRLVLPVLRRNVDADQDPRDVVNAEIQRMLEKYEIGHGRGDSGGKVEPVGRVAERPAITPPTPDPEEEKEDEGERAKIRNFWSRIKDKVTSGTVVPEDDLQ